MRRQHMRISAFTHYIVCDMCATKCVTGINGHACVYLEFWLIIVVYGIVLLNRKLFMTLA